MAWSDKPVIKSQLLITPSTSNSDKKTLLTQPVLTYF